MATVLVTGGTGDLGRCVVQKLAEQKQQVRILTRNSNFATGVRIRSFIAPAIPHIPVKMWKTWRDFLEKAYSSV